MAAVKNGSGDLRHIPPSPAAGAPGRRRSPYAAAGGLAAVLIAAVVLATSLGGKHGPKPAPADNAPYQHPSATGTYPLPAGTLSRVQQVPVGALIANAQAQLGGGQVSPPEKLPPGAPQLSSNGHPEIMFICAEYWSKCAAERWALVIAMSKFGTFTHLTGTTTSATQTGPNTPTFSFYGATYTSKYLTLVTDELETNTDMGGGEYPLLQPPTRQEMNLMTAWDRAPYTTINASLPFAYLGGKYLLTTTQYDASALSKTNFQTATHIMTSGTSAVAEHAQAAAGYLIADLCDLTHNQPTPVCTQLPPDLMAITTAPTWASPRSVDTSP